MADFLLHRASDHALDHAPDPGHSNAITLPAPRQGAIEVRTAVESDLPFIDELQKKHTKMVGWMPKGQLETYIKRGQVLIAEETGTKARGHEGTEGVPGHSHSVPPCLGASMPAPLGYCIAQDKYLKREELGIVYQLNVLPMKQRGLIGATLIKHVFDRAAYGCKLFCCWCAQDLEANHFWEAIGFVPLAFRAGSRKAGSRKEPRIHIFWQRRIREGDCDTPYWFPSETSGGAVRENRLVLPIPPGTHWSDAKPAIFPDVPGMENVNVLPAGHESRAPVKRKKVAPKPEVQPQRPSSGIWFAPPEPTEEEKAAAKKAAKEKAAKAKTPRFKNDPKLVAAARELRDRYMEQANEAGNGLLPGACGKYDVSRQLEAAPTAMKINPAPDMLEAA